MTEEQRRWLLADVPYRSILTTDWYQLDIGDRNFRQGLSNREVFELFVRRAPFGGAFLLVAGTLRSLSYLLFALSDMEANWLLKQGLSPEFVGYLQQAGPDVFRGVDIWAMDEGELAFPEEPLLRVEGPTMPVQLLETFALNAINFSTLIATKAARVRRALGPNRTFLEFGMRRAQDTAHLAASRSSFLGGADATSNVLAAALYDIPASGSVMHAQIQRYDDEVEAFRHLYRYAPDRDRVTLLLDTHNTLLGARHALQLAHEMRQEGHELFAVRLDSGDLAGLSRSVREMFDTAGHPGVRIILSGDLDEHRITQLLAAGARLDIAGVGTALVTGGTDPAIGGIYKLTGIADPHTGGIRGRTKRSDDPAKATRPGAHQVFRRHAEDGMLVEDLLALTCEEESLAAQSSLRPLLQPVVRDGEIIAPIRPPGESLRLARDRAFASLATLPEPYQRLEHPEVYPIRQSDGLLALINACREESGAGS